MDVKINQIPGSLARPTRNNAQNRADLQDKQAAYNQEDEEMVLTVNRPPCGDTPTEELPRQTGED